MRIWKKISIAVAFCLLAWRALAAEVQSGEVVGAKKRIAFVESLAFTKFSEVDFCLPPTEGFFGSELVKPSAYFYGVSPIEAQSTVSLNRQKFSIEPERLDEKTKLSGIFRITEANILVVRKPTPMIYVSEPGQGVRKSSAGPAAADDGTRCAFGSDLSENLAKAIRYNAVVTKREGQDVTVEILEASDAAKAANRVGSQAVIFSGSEDMLVIRKGQPIAAIAEVSGQSGDYATMRIILQDSSEELEKVLPGSKVSITFK